jgi:hypothetical protein
MGLNHVVLRLEYQFAVRRFLLATPTIDDRMSADLTPALAFLANFPTVATLRCDRDLALAVSVGSEVS